jgi:hypothetical protein
MFNQMITDWYTSVWSQILINADTQARFYPAQSELHR